MTNNLAQTACVWLPPPFVGEGWGGGLRKTSDVGIVVTDPEETPMSREFARDLRKNLTDAERRLWASLRLRQFDGKKFRRQATIGKYIVDFVCYESKLIVELDGGQHMTRVEYDEQRTKWLNSQGFHVLRFWNFQVLEESEAVLEAIWNALQDPAAVGER